MSTRGTFSAQIRPTQPCRRSFLGNPQMRASGAKGEARNTNVPEVVSRPSRAVSLSGGRMHGPQAGSSLQGLCLDRTAGDGEDTTMRTRINKTNEHRRCCEPARPYGALDQPMFPPRKGSRAIVTSHASQRTQPAFVQYLREAAPCQRDPPALSNRRLGAKKRSVQVTQGGYARVLDKVAVVEIGNKVRITLQSCVLHPLFENEKYKEDGWKKSKTEQELAWKRSA